MEKKNINSLKFFTETQRSAIVKAQKSLTSFQANYSDIIQQSLNATSYIQDSLQGLTSFANQLNNVNESLIQPFKQIGDQYKALAQTIDNLLLPQLNLWQSWAKNNSSALQNINNFWHDFQKEYDIAESKAVLILQKYKWFITPSMPITFLFKVIQIDKKKGRQDKAINMLFINYFSANRWRRTENMVASWKKFPVIKKRLKILENCVLILKRSRRDQNAAYVVLPTLITQIDGLLSDYLNSKDIEWDCDYDDIKRNKKVRVGRKTQFNTSRSKTMSTQLDDLANDIFLNILFQRSQKGKPLKTPFNFNRHKIIHGEKVNYGRKDYIVRAFMIIDFIAHLK